MDMSAQTYQVGAHFAALIEGILMAPLKTIERFFCISSSPAGLCYVYSLRIFNSGFFPSLDEIVQVCSYNFGLITIHGLKTQKRCKGLHKI